MVAPHSAPAQGGKQITIHRRRRMRRLKPAATVQTHRAKSDFVAEVVDGLAEAVFEFYLGFPVEQFPGAGGIGTALLGVVHGQGFVDDLTLAAGEFDDEFGEIEDGELGRVADVDGFVEIALGEAEDAVDEVAAVAKAAGLLAFAEDGEGFSAQRLADEGGDDAAVLESHAGAVCVEDADDVGIDFVVAMVGHGHGLGETLGFVVDAAGADGIDVAPVGFGLGMFERIAVAFGGGGEEEFGVFGLGEAEGVVGAERTDLEGLDGELEIIDGAGGRCEMEDVVDAAGEVDELCDVVVDELEVLVAGEMGDVVGIARDEVVDGDDAMAFGEEAVDEMGAEEAGAAGDDGDGSGCGGCHVPE